MNAELSPKNRALAIARDRGVARARDFAAAGIAPVYLKRLLEDGHLVRLGRGLYRLPGAELEAAHSLAEATRVVPHGVICLLSALQFHELTTQTPHQIWIMIGLHKWAPTRAPVSLRIIRATGEALTAGVQRHIIEGVSVPIYEPAKTIADCFKHRSKVGLDVAIEALRDCRRRRQCTADRLWHFARICRVQNVMRPYMEAIL